ncbi:MAG: hypothetical protein WEG56_03375 [Chloroflexota bacterium]
MALAIGLAACGGDVVPSAAPTVTSSTGPGPLCPIVSATGGLPSDRLVDIVVGGAGTADLLTFVFGAPSVGQPPAVPAGNLEVATPPYTHASSGAPVEVDGERVAIVRFTGMSIVNDVGQPTYEGPMDVRPDLPALKSVVNFDMSEGVVGWYVGYDGPGCITLSSDQQRVTVVIDHGPS